MHFSHVSALATSLINKSGRHFCAMNNLYVTVFALVCVYVIDAIKTPTIRLLNGEEMPQLGLGTWQAQGNDVYRATKEALRLGYRLIDTAWVYGNHKEIGQAIKEVLDDGKIRRKDIFITTKVWSSHYQREKTKQFVKEALQDLRVSYLDLVLIHYPDTNATESYQALEESIDEGTVLGAGLSNYDIELAEQIWNISRHKPVNIQNESHPKLLDNDVFEWCSKRGIAYTAYSAMKGLLKDSTVNEIASHYNKTAAQVLIEFEIQRGAITIPKTTHFNRLKENFDVLDFKLSDDDMNTLKNL